MKLEKEEEKVETSNTHEITFLIFYISFDISYKMRKYKNI